MNRKLFVVPLISFIFAAQGLFAQEAFTWHLALVKDNEGIPFDKTVSLNNGETFSIQLFTDKDCYAYVIVEQASGSLAPLMSKRMKAGDSPSSVRCTLSPPQGQEKFYVITSAEEQTSLQRAIETYNKDRSSRNSARLKSALFDVKDPKGDNPGKPATFAGSVRGENETVQGTEFSGSTTYTKTIVISH